MYYSQHGEDKYLNDIIFRNYKNGVYIEMGALDGVLYSNTKFFEDSLGWKGILIEPNPYQFNNLLLNRPNNKLYNYLISNSYDQKKYKMFKTIHAAVSGVVDTLPENHYKKFFNNEENEMLEQEEIYIKPVKLSDVVKDSGYNKIDLLCLDVEGHEEEVLKSYDFKVKINVIMIEMLEGEDGGKKNDESNERCREILRNNGYVYYSNIHWNEIWVLENI